MKAVILCGGQGIRLRDVTDLLPKPLVSIGYNPILWHIMKIYAHHGVNEFILCLGYKGWKIKEYFLNYKTIMHDFTISLNDHNSVQFHDDENNSESDWKITMAETGGETQTGARIWKVRKYLENEDHFCLTYGDGLADIDIGKLIEFHKSSGKIGTLTGVRPKSRFGEIVTEKNVISTFNEKPNISEGWVNGGFMVFDAKRVWDYFWPDESLVLERDPLPAMVRDRQLGVYKHDGFWLGMDTMREYTMLNEMWKENKAPWKVWQ